MVLPSGLKAFQEGGTSQMINQSIQFRNAGIKVKVEPDYVNVLKYANPLYMGVTGVRALSTGILTLFGVGQRKETVRAFSDLLPGAKLVTQYETAKGETVNKTLSITDFLNAKIKTQETQNPEWKDYWNKPEGNIFDFKFDWPDFGDLGKYAILGLLGIGLFIIATRRK